MNADPTEWLLEADDPSVRFFALTGLLGRSPRSADVRKAKQAIMEVGAVPGILATQKEGGYWGKPEDFYMRSKFAAIPKARRSKAVKATIKRAAEYLLTHRIFKRSHDLRRVSKPGWLKFGFPLFYQTDALEILEILTSLGYRDERMQEAVDLVISKRDRHGRWRLENTFNGRMQVQVEQTTEMASKALVPRGLVLVHVIDFDYLRAHPVRIEREGDLDGMPVIFEKRIDADDNGAVIAITVTKETGSGPQVDSATQRLHEWGAPFLKEVTSRFGLHLLDEFGGLDGKPRAPGSTKDVVLQFEKPARS